MASFWNDNLRNEVSELETSVIPSALEKQRAREGLIRSLRDAKTRRTFAVLDVARVCQLDASLLDEELLKMLREQTITVGKMFSWTSSLVDRYRGEIELGIRVILWWFSLRINVASPGEVLQNLRYRDERKFSLPHTWGLLTLANDLPTRLQRTMHLLLTVFAPWMWGRLRDYAVEERWGESVETEHWWSGLEATDKAYRMASLVNFLLFLNDGKYRSLADRVLKMRLVPARNESVRAVSFELINQQLLFDGFSEILLCILPLIDWMSFLRILIRWKNLVKSIMLWLIPEKVFTLVGLDADKDRSISAEEEEAARKCVSCGENPAVMPHRAEPCEHIYCYFCIKMISSRQASGTPHCISCDTPFEQAIRI